MLIKSNGKSSTRKYTVNGFENFLVFFVETSLQLGKRGRKCEGDDEEAKNLQY